MSLTKENAPEVSDYVAAVRAELGDLPTETVGELTDGLAADLAEAMAVPQDPSAGVVARFGPPETYAAELRGAAGLGTRRRSRLSGGWTGTFGQELSRASDAIRDDVRHQFGAVLAGQRWWPGIRDFLRAIRPSWWAFRAFLVYWYVSQLGSQRLDEPLGQDLGLPHSPLTWLAMLGLLVLSVELGRRRQPAIVGAATAVLNLWLLILVLLVLPVNLYWAW